MRRKYSFRFAPLLPTLTIFCRFVGLSIFVACTSCQYVNGILSSIVTHCFMSDFTVFQSTLCKKRSEPAFASAEICKTTNSCLCGRFCALPTFFFKIRPSDLTSRNWHDILIAVDGALAQLVAHNTGSVGVRSSNLLCSTKPKKSELDPSWGWVRISSFYLKYCGVINKTNKRRRIGIIPIVAESTL